MLFRRTPHLLRRKPRFRHAGWFPASLPAPDMRSPVPHIDELFIDRDDRSLWRVVQLYIDPPEWGATLEIQTEYWRPLRGSEIIWQLLEDGPEIRYVTASQAGRYDRPERTQQ